MKNYECISKRIKKLREKKGLTQQELADLCGVARNTIIRYENGKMIPTAQILDKLSFYLNTSIDYLFGISNNSKVEYSNIGALTGLSDNAISTLKKLKETNSDISNRALNAINTLLDVENYEDILSYFNNIYLFLNSEFKDETYDDDYGNNITHNNLIYALLLSNNSYLFRLKNKNVSDSRI